MIPVNQICVSTFTTRVIGIDGGSYHPNISAFLDHKDKTRDLLI